MLKIIDQFEGLGKVCGHIIPEKHNSTIHKNAAELKGTYDYYQILLKELENCIHSYSELHESLQKVMYPYVRKMNTELRKK